MGASVKNDISQVSQLFNFEPGSYLERSSRPVYALVFLLPFLVFYEIGTILLNTDALRQSQVRVVAFVWLQEALEQLGFTGKLSWALPPLVVVVILLFLQVASRKNWNVRASLVGAMLVESALLAVPLIVLSLAVNTLAAQPAANALEQAGIWICSAVEAATGINVLADIVTGIGAGIYEELVFRLILICVLMLILQDICRFSKQYSVILAVAIAAALFSAHHHVYIRGGYIVEAEPFNWLAFGFRTVAGIYFAVLFAIRGFGITAGTHAFHNIIATLLNAYIFTG